MRVVIVEDEVRIREGLHKLLGRLSGNYEIVGEAENGKEGLELIKQVSPEIVITDIRMPNMDGLEMLTRLYEEGIPVRAVVLSAYSEFEYARKAMKMGVTEYLLKPLDVTEFSRAISNVTNQIKRDNQKQPDELGTLEQTFTSILLGSLTYDTVVQEYLKRRYGISPSDPAGLLCIYLGNGFQENADRMRRNLRGMMSFRSDLKYSVIENSYEKALIMVVYGFTDPQQISRWFQHQMLSRKYGEGDQSSIGWVIIENVGRLKDAFFSLYPYIDWTISLGDEVLISYPQITKVHNVPCIYPRELEDQVKVALCTDDTDKLMKLVEEFHVYFYGGRIYAPKEIKESYVRFLWAIINIAKEIGSIDDRKLNQQKLLESIMDAKTRAELKTAVKSLLDLVGMQGRQDSGVNQLTVRRAVAMIQEFYQAGITLEQIADRLNITPEYLGTQFRKEMGMNFSTYIKDYRIHKAKELLISTQLKLYEIAEKIGYSDAKYFSRVFREATGQLPADYRKTNK